MKITLNGKTYETACRTVFELRDLLYIGDTVAILNGFCLAEDHLLHSGDFVTLIEKGKMPPEDELEAMMAARHTPKVHERLKKGTVAVAGLGGLGSNIAAALARSGVGRLILIDFDIVEPSNLNRQNYDIRHLGMYKTDATAQQLRQINPFIQIETHCMRVDEHNVKVIFQDADIICEAFDNGETKAMLTERLLTLFPEKKIVCGSGMAGYESANLIQTKRAMKNLYICGDFETEARIGNGLMAPRVLVCAGHQANMVLRLLLGMEQA